MAQRVGAVVDDEVVFVLFAAQKAQAVLVVDPHPDVVQAAGIVREIFAADVHKHLVRFHHVDDLDLLVMGQLPGDAAVPAADDQHPLDVGVTAMGTWTIISS